MLSSFALAAEAHNKLGLEISDNVVSSPDAYAKSRKRLVIRIPPLASLRDDMYRHEQYDMPAPGAPLLRTKELPECEMDELFSSRSCKLLMRNLEAFFVTKWLSSASSASSTPLLTPVSPLVYMTLQHTKLLY
jgi:hypothetical protein